MCRFHFAEGTLSFACSLLLLLVPKQAVLLVFWSLLPQCGVHPARWALTRSFKLQVVSFRGPTRIFVLKRGIVNTVSCDPSRWVRDFIVNNAISHVGRSEERRVGNK